MEAILLFFWQLLLLSAIVCGIVLVLVFIYGFWVKELRSLIVSDKKKEDEC